MGSSLARSSVLILVGVLCLAATLLAAPADAAPLSTLDAPSPLGPGPWVVKARYPSLETVRQVPPDLDVWGVLVQRGYLVALVDRQGWRQLVDLGFEVEVDEAETARLGRENVPLPFQGGGIPGFPCYRTVEETFATAAALAANHPQLATWSDIGDSWIKTQTPGQGYDVRVLRLTRAGGLGSRPKLLLLGSMHAREYAPPELITRFAEMLVEGYGQDPDITWILDHHEIHFVLMSNPDGRKRAETGLLWRKNADDDYCTGSNNRGADLNRNFTFEWGCCNGSSTNPCGETYRGAAAGSEPETVALENYMRAIFPDQRPPDLEIPAPPNATGLMLDMHSFGEAVLSPWSFLVTPPPNAAEIMTFGRKYGFYSGYRPQLGSFGIADGTTKDYSYGELGVMGYTIEMGTSFFQSCATFESQILPDNLPGLLYAAKVARTPYVTPSGPEALALNLSAARVERGESVILTAQVDDTRYATSNGTEPTQAIAAAEYTLDQPPWSGEANPIAMVASDGAFDETAEIVEATLDTTTLPTGRHLVYVRGRDAEGNWGAVSAIFLTVENELYRDGFETGDTSAWTERLP